jgi:two-component system LytT family response regulator
LSLERRIRALIVDDEPLARRNIALLLRDDPEIEMAGECGSGREAIAAIRAHTPDLVFLDVQMPDCDGFDVLEMLGKKLSPALIFVTAFDQYALRAFEAGALDYLLKPFDNARFHRALARAKEQIALTRALPRKTDRIVAKCGAEVLFIRTCDIDWIEAEDYYACLHVSGKKRLVRRSLAELERDLEAADFCRIHRSAIVNLDRIKTLKLNSEGEYNVILEDGSELPLSRRHRKDLESRLGMRAG